MTEETARVLAALENAMPDGAAVRISRPETEARCPAVLVQPAERLPVCVSGGETLLTRVTQPVRIIARSMGQLDGFTDRAVTAMSGLGYRLIEAQSVEGLPRARTLTFRATADSAGFIYSEENGGT